MPAVELPIKVPNIVVPDRGEPTTNTGTTFSGITVPPSPDKLRQKRPVGAAAPTLVETRRPQHGHGTPHCWQGSTAINVLKPAGVAAEVYSVPGNRLRAPEHPIHIQEFELELFRHSVTQYANLHHSP